MTISKRITALEERSPTRFGRVHRIIQHVGQSRDEAIASYGCEIASGDTVITRVVVSPMIAKGPSQ